jgi:hypothetical protein
MKAPAFFKFAFQMRRVVPLQRGHQGWHAADPARWGAARVKSSMTLRMKAPGSQTLGSLPSEKLVVFSKLALTSFNLQAPWFSNPCAY